MIFDENVPLFSLSIFRVNIDNDLIESGIFFHKLNLEARFYYVLWFCELLMKPGHARARVPSSTAAAT